MAELKLLTDLDMLLTVKKGIRSGMYYSIHQYGKANRRYMNDYDPSKESPYPMYWRVSNLVGWMMLQKLPIDSFTWRNDFFRFDEELI